MTLQILFFVRLSRAKRCVYSDVQKLSSSVFSRLCSSVVSCYLQCFRWQIGKEMGKKRPYSCYLLTSIDIFFCVRCSCTSKLAIEICFFFLSFCSLRWWCLAGYRNVYNSIHFVRRQHFNLQHLSVVMTHPPFKHAYTRVDKRNDIHTPRQIYTRSEK